jgi:hypothetical protein
MKKTISVIVIIIGFIVLSGLWPFMVSADTQGEKEVLYPTRVDVKPKIDGELNEEMWQTQPLDKDFFSYSPHVGEILPFKTQVWMTYDSNNLYFAFLCLDPEPEKIKTSIIKRDSMYNDDWVGLSLDTLGTKQTAWALFVNPNGIQGDILISDASESASSAPDLEWESAGKVTDKGYQVEIAIPLRCISFKSGKEVKMGILFWRNVTRLGTRNCWPKAVPGGKSFGTQTPIIYKDLKRPLKLELYPNLVLSGQTERVNPAEWEDWDNSQNIGFGLTYGITSSVAADITINPDFSQVEGDPFLYERRPFFEENFDIFNFFTVPINYNGYMPHAVFTRQVIDPGWIAKLTGTIGKTAFGILATGDEHPGHPWGSGENPNEGKDALWSIARGKYSLRKDSYIGLLYSGREFAGDHNRVFGVDAHYRFFTYHRFNASFLYSISSGGESTNHDVKDNSYNLMYFFVNKNMKIQAGFEHIGTDFRMASAYLMRTGINSATFLIRYNIIPNPKKINWLKQIETFIQLRHLHDLYDGMDDYYFRLSVESRFLRHAFAGFRYYTRNESWMGQKLDLSEWHIFAYEQVTKWLRVNLQLRWGDGIYYRGDPPFKGDNIVFFGYLELQPNDNWSVYGDFWHNTFSRDDEKIYTENIYNLRSIYQFNKYFSLRAIARYSSYHKRLLTDVLASFTLIPNTVLHVGYGGNYENMEWQSGLNGQEGNWLYRQGNLYNVKNSLFAKISYRWRL